jgi:site-specific recombinase XerD
MKTGVPRDQQLTKAKETWLLDCRAAGLSPKTMRAYRDALTAFIEYTGDITVRELGPDHVRRYIATLSERPGHYQGETFSSHSLLKHYAVIRTWIRWMYAQKIIEERITDYVKPPRLSTRLPSILTDQEVDAILDDLRKAGRFRDFVIFELFLDTGIRLQECADLTVEDVNIEGSWIHVIGKGDVEGIVPIGATVCRDLYTYIHVHRQPALHDEHALWLNDHGHMAGYALGYEGLSKMVQRELKKCRVQPGKRGAHVMRHTAGTNLIRGGASQEHVRRILRHRDGRITQAYLHLADEDLFDAHRAASPIDRRRTKSKRPVSRKPDKTSGER